MAKISPRALTQRERSQRIGQQLRTPAWWSRLETSSHGQSVLDGPESLIRFGIAKRTELRFTVPDYFLNLSAGAGSGFGDFAVGMKEQLGPTPGKFDASAILFLSFPTGANGVSSGGDDPGLHVPRAAGVSTHRAPAGKVSVGLPTSGRP